MTTLQDWPLLERVTNDEFFKLLPHLGLEHWFLTQIFVPKKKWIPMLHANLQTLQLKCGVCGRQVGFEDIKNHLLRDDHLMSLRTNVKQFYHPFYTYGKSDVKLARGDNVSQEMRERALRVVNIRMISFKRESSLAKQFANVAQRRSRGAEEDHLIETTLRTQIDNPDDMIVMVCLPFEDIPKLQFSLVSGEWQAVIGYTHLTKKSTFHCNICSVNCCGIESLNSHFNGLTHRIRQLGLLTVCYENSSRVNKNCCINFGNSFSFSIKENVKDFHTRHIKRDSGFQVKKLPTEIEKKIKALDKYVPKTLTCTDSLGQSSVEKDLKTDGKIESNEILGHLGVEYVLKVMKNENDRDPKFECGLCEFVGNCHKMQRHLLYYEHKKKYLDLHYSDTIKKYEAEIGHMCYREFRAVISEIVNKVAVEVENHHGRSLPYTVSLSDYKNRRPDLIAEAYALLHASQNRGPSFSNVLSKDNIRDLKNSAAQLANSKTYESIEYTVFTMAPNDKIYLNQMNHDPVVRLREYNAKMNKNQPAKRSRSLSPTQTRDAMKREESHIDRPYIHNYDRITCSKSPTYGRQRSPIRKAQGIFHSSDTLNQNIWDVYRQEIAFAANEIEVAYENYRKNPESHPLYEEEWNRFWQHRKKELEREGYNHRTYNFQPEWVHYFKQRIELLFGESLHKSKIDIRHRLEIPLDAEEDCQRSHEYSGQYAVDHRMEDNAVQDRDINANKRNKRRGSTDFKVYVPLNKRAFPERMDEERKESTKESQITIDKINDNHSNVIHVLRLMTALEEHLGSLGGRVMDLFSNALQLEKSFPGTGVQFEAKVLTIANCHLLETAMEKLKGILYAGLLDEKKISGFNRVIKYTANLLKYAEKMGWRQENNKSETISNRARVIQENMNANANCSQLPSGKALSDTLMDLINTPQISKQQVKTPKEQFDGYKEEPVCPPPPTIMETHVNTSLLAGLKGNHNSGLASFNTKLSLDQTSQIQTFRNDLPFQPEFGQLNISSGNSLYNYSFRNNNETRTNIKTRTSNGPNFGGGKNNNSGSSPQFRNSQFIPLGQNNAMYQGGGGGNHNKNWSNWNNIN